MKKSQHVGMLIDVTLVGLAYLAVFESSVYAYRLVAFAFVVNVILTTMAMFFPDAEKVKMRDRLRLRPAWTSYGPDLATLLMFVMGGWWWLAAAVTWSLSCELAIRDFKTETR